MPVPVASLPIDPTRMCCKQPSEPKTQLFAKADDLIGIRSNVHRATILRLVV